MRPLAGGRARPGGARGGGPPLPPAAWRPGPARLHRAFCPGRVGARHSGAPSRPPPPTHRSLTLDVGHLLMAGENPAQAAAMVGAAGKLYGLQLNDAHVKLGAEVRGRRRGRRAWLPGWRGTLSA